MYIPQEMRPLLEVAGVRVESTEHMTRVHATQGAVPLAWLAQWGCCLSYFVCSVLYVDL